MAGLKRVDRQPTLSRLLYNEIFANNLKTILFFYMIQNHKGSREQRMYGGGAILVRKCRSF